MIHNGYRKNDDVRQIAVTSTTDEKDNWSPSCMIVFNYGDCLADVDIYII